MFEEELLSDQALGDESAILSGAPLGQPAVDGGAPAKKLPAWSPDLLSITVRSPNASCMGGATPKSLSLLSACGRLEHLCTTPARWTFEVMFHVDVDVIGRPLPFAPPAVSLTWSFRRSDGTPLAPGVPAGGSFQDPAPAYRGPGVPLHTSFPRRFTIESGGDGLLELLCVLRDSAGTVQYQDSIACVLLPCG